MRHTALEYTVNYFSKLLSHGIQLDRIEPHHKELMFAFCTQMVGYSG